MFEIVKFYLEFKIVLDAWKSIFKNKKKIISINENKFYEKNVQRALDNRRR